MKANKITLMAGIVVFMVAMGSLLVLGGYFAMFIHIPTAFFVVLMAGGLGLTAYRGGGLLRYIDACKKHFISAGILGTIMGIIILLANLESSEAMGKGVAFALLSVFYGVVLYCISDALVTGAREVL